MTSSQPNHAAVDTTALDSGGVPSPSLFNHLPRLINARDMPRYRQARQALNNHTGSETHFQHAVVWSDLKEATDPGAAISIRARHDDATQPPQDALRAAKHAHQNISHDTHRWPTCSDAARGMGSTAQIFGSRAVTATTILASCSRPRLVPLWSFTSFQARGWHDRFTPMNGHIQRWLARPNRAHVRTLAGVYSITSSARASSAGGTSRPSVFAVLRLMTSSNFVGC